MAQTPESTPGDFPPPRRIRLWQQRRALRQTFRAYPPGTDALVDQMRSGPALQRFLVLQVMVPLHFAAEEGWYIPGPGGEMAAIIYLQRRERQGIRVMHIDDINVDTRYRRQGLAERLMRHAEALARQEHRSFLKLAVTVANTPAVTLYRRLGYREQHHRFFTFDPAAATLLLPESSGVSLHALGKDPAAAANQRYYRQELQASDPEVAAMMLVYYPLGAGGEGVPTIPPYRYEVRSGDQAIGYADAYLTGSRWNLRLGLLPDYWGTDGERQTIKLLTGVVCEAAATGGKREESGGPFALHVSSTAHFDALAQSALASQLGLSSETYTRMLMAKELDDSTAKEMEHELLDDSTLKGM